MAIGKSCRCCEISRIVWQRCKVQNEADAVPLRERKKFLRFGGGHLDLGGGGVTGDPPQKNLGGVTVTLPQKNLGGVTGDPPHRKSFCRTKISRSIVLATASANKLVALLMRSQMKFLAIRTTLRCFVFDRALHKTDKILLE